MDLRASRAVVALTALPLASGALVLLPGVFDGSASAACAPSVSVRTTAGHAAKKPKVHAAKPVISKLRKKEYVAKIVLAVRQGTATVALTQSVCPDGAAGAAATTTQTASGTGVMTKTVSAKGHSKKAAKKAVKRKAEKATGKLKKKGASKRGRTQAEKRAAAAARTVAATKAHDALYLSDVVYVTLDSSNAYRLSPTPPTGQVVIGVAPTAGGDIQVSVPAGFDRDTTQNATCIRRAPAWPRSYVFDGGALSSPQLQAWGSSPDAHEPAGLDLTPENVADGSTTATSGPTWMAGWDVPTSNEGPQPPEYYAGVLTSEAAPAVANLVCVLPNADEPSGYTARIHGARVGTDLVEEEGEHAGVYDHLASGVPVALR